jgi:hypothetical protein
MQNGSEVYTGAFTGNGGGSYTFEVSSRGMTGAFLRYICFSNHLLSDDMSFTLVVQISYEIPSAYVGVKIATRGDTLSTHVNFMNQVNSAV